MIEKFMGHTGLRLKWSFPGDHTKGTKDGSLIPSPDLSPGPMTYDGMDGKIYDLSLPHAATLGLTMGMAIPHTWLTYSVGHTTKLPLGTDDVLTGYMSGCMLTV